MTTRLFRLALAASAAILSTAPAAAQHWSRPGYGAAANVTVHRAAEFGRGHGAVGPGAWESGSEHRRHGGGGFGYPAYYGGFGYAEANRTWEPDSYNDWWHERPNRSMPRWVQSNGNCERQWWSGGGWRC